MRIPIASDLKTRTGSPDKDARLKNSYVEAKGDPQDPNRQTVVRKRPIAQGGISVGTGQAQGGIGFTIGSTPYFIGFWGDTMQTYTGSGTSWDIGTAYSIGDHVSVGFVDYWAIDANTGNNPTSSPSHWSATYIPAAPYVPSTWTQRVIPSATWTDICWNGTVYCAVANITGVSATSSNGISWSSGTMPTGLYAYKVIWNGTKFLAAGAPLGSFNTATSTDGISWTGGLIPYGNGGDWLLAWNGTIFCAIETNVGSVPATAVSSDGITWTEGVIASSTWTGVAYGNGVFVAVCTTSTSAYSTDGINWSYTNCGIGCLDIVFGNGIFVATQRNGSATTYSADGINWSSGVLPTSAFWGSIAWSGTYFMAIAASRTSAGSVAAYSLDGINWTQTAMPTSSTWNSCASNGLDFCAVAYNTTIGATTP